MLRKLNFCNKILKFFNQLNDFVKANLSTGIDLNLNHRLFRIWQYLCHSIMSQNSVYYLQRT